jgi:hypothetical protein
MVDVRCDQGPVRDRPTNGPPIQDRGCGHQCRTLRSQRQSSDFHRARSEQVHPGTCILARSVESGNTLDHGTHRACANFERQIRNRGDSRFGGRNKDAFRPKSQRPMNALPENPPTATGHNSSHKIATRGMLLGMGNKDRRSREAKKPKKKTPKFAPPRRDSSQPTHVISTVTNPEKPTTGSQ